MMCGKKLTLSVIFMLFLGLFAGPARAIDMDKIHYQWIQKDIQINDYEDIYIYQLDLRDMLIESEDDEESFADEPFDGAVLEDIAANIYQKFVWRLKGILPINKSQQIDKTKRSLVIKMKISGKFPYEERGLIMEKFLGGIEQEVPLQFECKVLDAGSEKEVLLITDTQKITLEGDSEPLTSDDEMAKMSEILDFWARRFADIILEKKKL